MSLEEAIMEASGSAVPQLSFLNNKDTFSYTGKLQGNQIVTGPTSAQCAGNSFALKSTDQTSKKTNGAASVYYQAA